MDNAPHCFLQQDGRVQTPVCAGPFFDPLLKYGSTADTTVSSKRGLLVVLFDRSICPKRCEYPRYREKGKRPDSPKGTAMPKQERRSLSWNTGWL